MRKQDLFRLCLQNLLRKRSRTFLTVLGVVIGGCSIVIMVSLGIGMKEAQDKLLSQLGDLTIITVTAPQGGRGKVKLDDAINNTSKADIKGFSKNVAMAFNRMKQTIKKELKNAEFAQLVADFRANPIEESESEPEPSESESDSESDSGSLYDSESESGSESGSESESESGSEVSDSKNSDSDESYYDESYYDSEAMSSDSDFSSDSDSSDSSDSDEEPNPKLTGRAKWVLQPKDIEKQKKKEEEKKKKEEEKKRKDEERKKLDKEKSELSDAEADDSSISTTSFPLRSSPLLGARNTEAGTARPSVETISAPRGRKNPAMPMACSNNPPPFPRRSRINLSGRPNSRYAFVNSSIVVRPKRLTLM